MILPKNTFKGIPFPPLHIIDRDEKIDSVFFDSFTIGKGIENGISILLRSNTGHDNRGGYYFHFKSMQDCADRFSLFNFENNQVALLSKNDLILMINHCSGREYSDSSYELCQTKINLRDDP